jgi:hypothetical protein
MSHPLQDVVNQLQRQWKARTTTTAARGSTESATANAQLQERVDELHRDWAWQSLCLDCTPTHGNINGVNREGQSPLSRPAWNGHPDCCRSLVILGADVNGANSDGETPVFLAAGQGHDHCLHILFELGADINTADNNGTTPLFAAACQGREEAIHILFELGADINTADNNGTNPVAIADCQGHETCVRLLQRLETHNTASGDHISLSETRDPGAFGGADILSG